MQNECLSRAGAFGLSVIFFLTCIAGAFVPSGSASASTFSTIYSLSQGGPTAPLIVDSAGNLYGTASGGVQNDGVVFELSPAGNNSWNYQILYSFCAKTNCTDGSFPTGPVVIDKNGNLYGTTYDGGASNNGIAFELLYRKSPPYRLKVLRSFCEKTNCVDGKNPGNAFTYAGAASNAPYDGVSPLYSTFFENGTYGKGFVFALEPPAQGEKKWVEKSIYAFCSGGGLCADGGFAAGVSMDGNGNLFGTTAEGGANSGGELFELSPRGKRWTLKLLHSFCAQTACTDGAGSGGFVIDTSGNIYGVTNAGGLPNCGGGGCGVAYKLTPSGKTFQFTQLYSFCSQANCTDGFNPNTALVLDASGNLFGATFSGGSNTLVQYGAGVLFELSGTNYQVLHTFCVSPCSDGANPVGGVTADKSGNLFGSTVNLGGTIFEWSK